MDIFKTKNEFGSGVVKSWASILDTKTREQAEKVSRVPILEGYMALMPDAHFGYGPPVGSVIKTRGAVMPYAVGVDIGCGIIAMKTRTERGKLAGAEGKILGQIRDRIPSGVGTRHDEPIPAAQDFIDQHGWAPGLDNVAVMGAAMNKRHRSEGEVRDELAKKITLQFGTLGAGNHFVEVCEDKEGMVWLLLHSGSRGIGNVLATAHVKRAKALCENVALEDRDFAYVYAESELFHEYIADMLWAQQYAYSQREAMMDRLKVAVEAATGTEISVEETVNCHHNYAEEIEPGLWLTRKGAINAEKGRLGIIPGSMGAETHIVMGKGCEEAYNTAPHGAGRVLARGAARRNLNLEDFKQQMAGRTWLDRDAEKLLDEAPQAYKPIAQIMEDSADLVETVAVLNQFVNYKGL